MARHEIRSARPRPAKPKAELRAAPSFYERTHPVGSAERFLDEAAKEALVATAAGGVITPRQAAVGAVRAVAKEAGKYPDPLLAEAAKLPKDELLKRAAKAEAYQKAMDVQNKIAAAAAAVDSPVGRMAATLVAADAADALGVRQDAGGGYAGGRNTVSRVEARNTTRRERERVAAVEAALREERRPKLEARPEGNAALHRVSLPEWAVSKLPTGASRDLARLILHGFARTGNTILRAIDIPNRVFGNSRSLLQDIYEKSEANLARDGYEDQSGVSQFGETAVHLASAGVLGKALPAVFGANVGADTYETAKYAGASEGEALAKGAGHGVVDTAIWTLGQGLASKYLPKAWQWLGREIVGAGRGAASSVTSDAVLNSLGADISGEEMAKRAVHAAWMVPLLGMLKMGKGSRERALAELKKVRPDLAGERVDKVIETLENEFSDPRSQKVALAWVARKGANLPDDLAQIHQAIEVANKVKGVDFTQKSPFEIISDPRYARYLPKPKPQDVKAFSNMKRYPMGVIGFDVSDDAAGRQATREMINAYMSPSSNPWCLATGSGAAKLGELGPGAESYWKQHSAVPKQIFFQEVDGKLELTAFRATGPGGEGRQEYWDTSDAGYSGIPLKVKVPGDPMGRYRKMVFRPKATYTSDADRENQLLDLQIEREQFERDNTDPDGYMTPGDRRHLAALDRRMQELHDTKPANSTTDGEVQGTFEDIAPGKVFKGNPFRDGRSQTWVRGPDRKSGDPTIEIAPDVVRSALERRHLTMDLDGLRALRRQMETEGTSGELDVVDDTISMVSDRITGEENRDPFILVEDKVRTTEKGITKFRTTKYADPTDWDYKPPKPGEQPRPVEIEESELVSPEWMRARGYDPESEADVRKMQQELGIQGWGNGVEAAMAVVPTKRTYMQTKSGTPETMTYGPNGRDVVSVDFVKDGVPYREEYFRSGPAGADPSPVLHRTIYSGEFPHPTVGFSIGDPSGFRLVRSPGSASPEVLNDIQWDEGLGSFVRTSGNRRWRIGDNPALNPEGKTLWDQYQKALRARANDYLASGQERLNNLMRRGETERAWTSWAREHGVSGDDPTRRILVEDRQPDGTWALVETSNIQASPSRANALPPPPDDVPFALKAGRTRRNVRAAEGGGDTPGDSGAPVPEGPVPEGPAPAANGPRIVINPQVFRDKRDALCVAFNEAFRVVMEDNAFEPVSEPTERQRRFFADTAYADDELQLRRTLLARIATLDTSVSDPTDEQLEETAEMLEMVMEVGAPQNEWEQQAVQRLHDVVAGAVRAGGAR